MSYRLLIYSIFFGGMVLLLFPGAVISDELFLKNNDRLTGLIVEMAGEKLTFETSYGGKIVVIREEISGLKSSGVLVFTLADGTVIEGVAQPTEEEGRIGIRSAGTAEITFHDFNTVKGIASPGKKDDRYFKGRLNAAAYLADGNRNAKTHHFESEIVGRAEKNRLTVGGSYDAASDQGRKTEENGKGHLKYDYFLGDKWYLYANGAAAKDRFRDLNLRTFVGFGAGRQIWESATRNLSFEAGLGYTDVDYESAPDEHYPSARWAAGYDRQLFDTAARFFHKHELLIGLEDFEDLILQAKTGLGLPLYRNFNAAIQVDVEWDNRPAAGTERTDTHYRVGIDYTW
ncbi:MAG: DUF481 domain-containing protein [Desulfurivibrionaceae bacterium]|nr:DUF481 domain-containing protein [Desulfurivibrionaceae bacterium]